VCQALFPQICVVYDTKKIHIFLVLYNRCSTLSFVFELVESRLMTKDRSESDSTSPVKPTLPGLMGNYSDEELNAHVVKHAKYFTVVQVTRGGFVGGGKNYDRHQVDTLEDARAKAKELYDTDPSKRGILIYAVADFAGANGFSRPVENYPPTTYMTKGDKAKLEKKQKAEARQRLRDARMNLGEGRINKRPAKPAEMSDDEFMNNPEPMVRVEP
jgi:hypothetical protein